MIARARTWLRAEWRALLSGALGVLLPVLFLAWSVTDSANVRAAAARQQLQTARAQLAQASTLLRQADSARADERRRIDSLWGVINGLRFEARVRQRTMVPKTADTVLQRVAAERDTAFWDRDSLQIKLTQMKLASAKLTATAITILVRDSAQDARIGALITAADTSIAAADRRLRRRWYQKLGGAVKTGARTVVIGGIGYVIGRVS